MNDCWFNLAIRVVSLECVGGDDSISFTIVIQSLPSANWKSFTQILSLISPI